MPIYEYKCRDCGKVSEFLIGVGQEKAKLKCSSCGSKKLEKIFSQSFISTSGHIIGSQGGKTCCGRTERCDTPPCSSDGICKR
jgi:putative FmdB family regulatory protein